MMKINRKNIIISAVILLFVIGIIPKISRFITTSMNAKDVEYVAIVEEAKLSDGEAELELSGELKPFLQTEIFSRINGLVKDRYVQLGEKVNKGQLAKSAALSVGNFFVKGLSMGVAAVSGAIKNEDDNRLKSSAGAMYEASPFSLVKKGEDLYIEKNTHFFLKFSLPNMEEESEESNVFKGQNYSYTTEKE